MEIALKINEIKGERKRCNALPCPPRNSLF